MATAAYILSNLANEQTSGTAPLTAWPIDNAWDGKSYKPVRWAESAISIGISGGGSCNGVALCSHNIKTGASVAITPSGGSAIYPTVKTGRSLWCKFPSPASAVTIAVSNTEAISIGEIIVGVPTVFSRQFSYGHQDNHEYVNDLHLTEFGATLAYEKYNARVLRLPFNAASNSVRDQIELLFANTKGGLIPFLFIPDPDANDCVFGRLSGSFQSASMAYGFWNTGFEIREEPTVAII